MRKRFLEAGKIVSTHGVRGEVKVQHWCDAPEYLCGFSTLWLEQGKKPLAIEKARASAGMVLLKIRGIDDMDAAVTLRGKIVYIDREDAPEDGAVFIQDLLGLEVRDIDSGRIYGTVRDVLRTGANDVYDVADEAGKQRLVPVIPDVVLERNLEEGYVLIRPLEGLFDDEN